MKFFSCANLPATLLILINSSLEMTITGNRALEISFSNFSPRSLFFLLRKQCVIRARRRARKAPRSPTPGSGLRPDMGLWGSRTHSCRYMQSRGCSSGSRNDGKNSSLHLRDQIPTNHRVATVLNTRMPWLSKVQQARLSHARGEDGPSKTRQEDRPGSVQLGALPGTPRRSPTLVSPPLP